MRNRFFDINSWQQLYLLTEWAADSGKKLTPGRDGDGNLVVGIKVSEDELIECRDYIENNLPED